MPHKQQSNQSSHGSGRKSSEEDLDPEDRKSGASDDERTGGAHKVRRGDEYDDFDDNDDDDDTTDTNIELGRRVAQRPDSRDDFELDDDEQVLTDDDIMEELAADDQARSEGPDA